MLPTCSGYIHHFLPAARMEFCGLIESCYWPQNKLDALWMYFLFILKEHLQCVEQYKDLRMVTQAFDFNGIAMTSKPSSQCCKPFVKTDSLRIQIEEALGIISPHKRETIYRLFWDRSLRYKLGLAQFLTQSYCDSLIIAQYSTFNIQG